MKKLSVFIFFTIFNLGSFYKVIAQKLPNIVIYLADDQSQADGSVYGAKILKTPTADKLAKAGITFNNAFVASPSCAPSRGAFLTGLMPAKNGAECNHTYPSPSKLVLTENLQKAGYQILSFGKVAHGSMNEEMGKDGRFDYQSSPKVDLYKNVTEYFDANNTKGPICLMVGDRRPHVPWTTNNIYNPNELTLPPSFIDTKSTRQHWAQYYSDITGMDDEMGKVYKLAQNKFGDNFIFIYTADHGAQWPFHKWNLYDKGIKVPMIAVWPKHIKPNTRTDAMVSWIDILPTLLDITNSEIPKEIDGKSFKNVLEGKANKHRNLIFTTHTGDQTKNVYPIRSVRDTQFKFILNLRPNTYHSNHSDILRRPNSDGYWDSWDKKAEKDPRAAAIIQKYYVRPAEEFYDLANDPDEQVNLIFSEKHQQKIKAMRLLLDDWLKEQADNKDVYTMPYPINGPKPHDIYKTKNSH
ncbi:sulfatase family protein [Polaribacter sp. L3A8]|uniref:sulfatase family protein n=1 Tax=Polaribacter sp. L3A8 TaxID=2686361 RepID=UPI00131C10A2|nr:sulfatase [Polaribacter sp. L3A8]